MYYPGKQRYPILALLVILSLALLQGACSSDAVEESATPTRATSVSTPQRHGPDRYGSASYYHADGRGNCSFDASDDHYVAALNTRDYAEAALCGAYLQVTGPQGKVVVRVTDRCPGCKTGGLDLSKEAFAAIAPLSAGRIKVEWHLVSGPVEKEIAIHYQKGSSRYWSALQVRHHRWPIAQVEVLPAGKGGWVTLQRRRHNYFVHQQPLPEGMLQARLTAVTGETLEFELPPPQGEQLIDTGRQFVK